MNLIEFTDVPPLSFFWLLCTHSVGRVMELVDAVDSSPIGRPTWIKVLFRLFLLYLVLGFFCWEELRYRALSVDVPGTVLWVKETPKSRLLVRYEFHEPETGQRRQKTVTVGLAQRPPQRETTVQWIDGETPQSRLVTQARPIVIQIFFWANILFGIAALAVIVHAARECHFVPDHNLPARVRGLSRFERRRRAEKAWRSGH